MDNKQAALTIANLVNAIVDTGTTMRTGVGGMKHLLALIERGSALALALDKGDLILKKKENDSVPASTAQ